MLFEQELNNSKIIELLKNDDIGRNKYLLSFLKIMKNSKCNRIYSLNGNWGSGKTIFVRKLDLLIKYSSLYENGIRNAASDKLNINFFTDDEIKKMNLLTGSGIYKSIDELVKKNNINSIYFNAWEHDSEEDPILSILYTIIKDCGLKSEKSSSEFDDLLKQISIIIKNLSFGKLDFSGIIKKENLVETVEKNDKIKSAICVILDYLVKERCEKLLFFIDELDRCNPKYVMRLLERIKHYFNNDKMIIVVSTNLNELSNIISTVYGNKESSVKYLGRIFDCKFELPPTSVDNYIRAISVDIPQINNETFYYALTSSIKYNRMELREINRYFEMIGFIISNVKQDIYFTEIHRWTTYIDFLVIPYAMGKYVTRIDDYYKFVDNKGWEEFKDFLFNDSNFIEVCKTMFQDKITNIESAEEVERILIEQVHLYYEALFEKDESRRKNFGCDYGAQKNSEVILDKLSLLGSLSDFGEKYQENGN